MLVLWVAPYSLFFILYSLFFTPCSLFFVPCSLFLVLYSLLLILLLPSSFFLPPLSSSYLLSVKPPYNSDMKRVSCSENVNFVR